MLPANYIPISNSPLSGKKRAIYWKNFVFDRERKIAALVVTVSFFEADAASSDGYGNEIVTMELHSYDVQLPAINSVLVNPANGIHVHKVIDTPAVPSSTAPDGTVTLATPEVSHMEDALGNTVTSPIGEFDFFQSLMMTSVVVNDVVTQVVQHQDTLYHKFNN